ncbi:hypothetical protein BHM03_00030288 [Ensete ventricosum]|nr:hypothetical protein BHM03_00030288 [Ensete ventricosum]
MGAVPVSTSLADGRRPCMQCLCQQTLPLWAPTPCGLVAGERRPLSAGSERSPLAVALATCGHPCKGPSHCRPPLSSPPSLQKRSNDGSKEKGRCPWPGPLHGWPTTAGPLQGWPNAASAANKGSGHPRLARKGRRLPRLSRKGSVLTEVPSTGIGPLRAAVLVRPPRVAAPTAGAVARG